MATIKSFEDLEIWQKAQQLAADIYLLVDQNQKMFRDYSYKDQIKRAVLSISNNIAEGFEYSNTNDFIKYLRFAKGSAGEVRNCLLFAIKVNFVIQSEVDPMINEVRSLSAQIGNLIKYLKQQKASPLAS
ncbi:MAG: four helix bundle protein [Ferruginibacter sp.]